VNQNLKAVIFDLDGVLCNTSRLHAAAWRRVVEELGIEPPPDLEDAVRGISRMASLKLALGGHANDFSQEELDDLAERKNRYYIAALAGLGPDDALPGAVELLDALRGEGIKLALASASRNARQVIEALGIATRFDAVADGNSYRFGKPHPDIFLTAAAMTGARPAECIVVEDASAGIDAALDGGFVALGIGKNELLFHAHAVVPDLLSVSVPMLRRLHGQFNPDRWILVGDSPRLEANRSVSETFAVRNRYLIVPAVYHFSPPGLSGREIRVLGLHDADTLRAVAPSDLVQAARLIEQMDFFGGRVLLNGNPFPQSSNSATWRLDTLHGVQTLSIEQRMNDAVRFALVQETVADTTHHGRFLAKYAFEPVGVSGELEIETGLAMREASGDAFSDMRPLQRSGGKPPCRAVCLTVRCSETLFVAAASCLIVPDGAEPAEQSAQSPNSVGVRVRVALHPSRLTEFERVCAVAAACGRERAMRAVLDSIAEALARPLQALRRTARASVRQLWQSEHPNLFLKHFDSRLPASDYFMLFDSQEKAGWEMFRKTVS